MTATLAPFGLRVAYPPVGNIRPRAVANAIQSGYGTAIYMDQPVLFTTSGLLQPVAANNVDFIGTFAGCQFTDSLGRFRVSNYWPAGQTYLGDFTAFVNGMDDPDLIYEIQADGSIPQTGLLDQASLNNFANNGAGYSQATISATLVGAGVQGQLAIIDKGLQVDNDWGDAYTIVRVRIARHQLRANKVAV